MVRLLLLLSLIPFTCQAYVVFINPVETPSVNKSIFYTSIIRDVINNRDVFNVRMHKDDFIELVEAKDLPYDYFDDVSGFIPTNIDTNRILLYQPDVIVFGRSYYVNDVEYLDLQAYNSESTILLSSIVGALDQNDPAILVNNFTEQLVKRLEKYYILSVVNEMMCKYTTNIPVDYLSNDIIRTYSDSLSVYVTSLNEFTNGFNLHLNLSPSDTNTIIIDPKEHYGQITIVTDTNTNVYVNNVLLTNLSIFVDPGTYKILLKTNGYYDESYEIKVNKGENMVIKPSFIIKQPIGFGFSVSNYTDNYHRIVFEDARYYQYDRYKYRTYYDNSVIGNIHVQFYWPFHSSAGRFYLSNESAIGQSFLDGGFPLYTGLRLLQTPKRSLYLGFNMLAYPSLSTEIRLFINNATSVTFIYWYNELYDTNYIRDVVINEIDNYDIIRRQYSSWGPVKLLFNHRLNFRSAIMSVFFSIKYLAFSERYEKIDYYDSYSERQYITSSDSHRVEISIGLGIMFDMLANIRSLELFN